MNRLDLLVSDTPIPDIFISDFLPELEGDAVKIYILLCQLGQGGGAVDSVVIASRLGLTPERVKAMLVPLATAGLAETDGEMTEVRLRPIKQQELLKEYRPKTSRAPSEIGRGSVDPDARRLMIQSIAQTFFHNMMSAGWYSVIDTWFDEYRFAPEVVYALFQECERRGNLKTRAYAQAVAENWHRNEVRTAQDLERYWKDHEQVRGLIGRVRKHLNRPDVLTRAEQDMVRKWADTWGFDADMIDEAFRRAPSASRPNLRYFDEILRAWHAAGVRTPDDVRAYDEARAKRRADEKELQQALGRRSLTTAEQQIYAAWRSELGYSHETLLRLIAELSARSRQGISMNYLDTVIRSYYDKGLTTLEAIGRHELERRDARGSAPGTSRRRSDTPTGNFDQRDYDDAYIASIYQHAWDAIAEQTDAAGKESHG